MKRYIILFLYLCISLFYTNAQTLQSPLYIGSQPYPFTYTDTQNTANFSNSYGRATNEVVYVFRLTTAMEVTFSNCNSSVSDTYMYLLDASKTLIVSNDDYSGEGQCSNTNHSYIKRQLVAGTYYVVSEGYSQNGNITTTIQGTVSTPVPIQVQASQNQNYIKTRTYISETGSSYLDVVQYYDGLGHPNQQVQVGVTPSQQDLITVQEYDPFGRESKTWLPVPKANNRGTYYNTGSLTTDSRATYGNDNYAYSEPQYEPSPLNRIEKQYGPGQTWRTANRPVSTEYRTNTANDCAKYSVSGNNLVRSAYYDANTLYVTQITDEDNKISYEYTDKLGRVVLQRQMDGSTQHNTYYVYDYFGNLRFVLPPLAADATSSGTFTETSTAIKDYVYQYRYDDRNRCNWKRLPGCEPVTYMYDTADRVIFTQDGELRNSSNHWRFSIPDVFGRVVLEGICTSPFNSGVSKAEYQISPSGTFAAYGYTVSGTGLTLVQMLQVNYYDNYQFKSLSQHINNNSQYNYATPAGFENKRYGTDNSTDYSAKGLLTGSITAILDNSASLHSVYYYDSKMNYLYFQL